MRRVDLNEFVGVLDVLEGTGVGAWGLDVDTSRVVWSPNIGPLFGLETGYEPGSLDDTFDLIYHVDAQQVSGAVEDAMENGHDYEVDFRVVWPDGTVRWLSARGHPILDTEGRVVRVVGVVSDANERKRESERNRFLATAGALLGQSLDIATTLDQIAELLTDGLSDWCSVQLLTDGRFVDPPVTVHSDPEMLALAERLRAEYPPDPEPAGLAATVIDSGQAALLEDVNEDLLRESAQDETHFELLKSLGLRSALIVPVIARGTVLGLMTLVSAESRLRFTESDLEFAAEVGRRAGTAIDNARLHEASIRAAEEAERVNRRLLVMQNVLSSLSQAVDVASVASVAIVEGASALGASRGSVVLRGEDGLEVVASVGYTPERLEAFAEYLDAPGPLAEALNDGRTVYVESVTELADRYPNLTEVMARTPSGAFTAVPLRTSDETIGAIGFVYDTDRHFSYEDRAFNSALAQHVSLAIERSMQFESTREMVDVLHSAIAPDPIINEEVPAAARFRAASFGAIGGDWHDMVSVRGGRRFFVVGDVVGRGMRAVGAMTALRHSLRMLLQVGYPADRAFMEIDRLASIERSAMGTTAICVEARTDSGMVSITSAGHLPPIVVSASGARPLWIDNGPPFGVPGRSEGFDVLLQPEDFLVLYTDGAVECAGEAVDESIDRLCRLLAEIERDEQLLSDAVMSAVGDTDDDVTVVVISGRRPSIG